VPKLIAPSKNETDPAGVAFLPAVNLTFAVSVTCWPKVADFREAASVVRVPSDRVSLHWPWPVPHAHVHPCAQHGPPLIIDDTRGATCSRVRGKSQCASAYTPSSRPGISPEGAARFEVSICDNHARKMVLRLGTTPWPA
jgi:hypothetical protein